MKNLTEAANADGRNPVLVCAPELRPAVRRLVSAQDGGLTVLSYAEVTAAAVPFETVGVIRSAQQISA